ncbi:MAG TPA: Gfo/Idh/MocA family oxidoreductase [Anaerolineae bacterium]|nr:Gfo/Idh/MocA family oxidoreductase [Anaerolineae bacterium]
MTDTRNPGDSGTGTQFEPDGQGKGATRLAIVGCGAIAEQYYLPALRRRPDVLSSLILVDRDASRAEHLATKFGVQRTSTDFHEIISQVDGVILAVPTHLHHPIAMQFLEEGVHVFSEKPLAENADRAREMVELAEEKGLVLAGNYQRRLFPPLVKVKELLDSGALGDLRSIRYLVGELFDWEAVTGFRFNTGTSAGGVLRDRGAHVMYVLCWWLGGKPTLLSSQNDSWGGPEAVAEVHFQDQDCRGEVKLSWLSKFTPRFEVVGEKARVEGGIYDTDSVLLTTSAGKKRRLKLPPTPRTYLEIAYGMVGNFLNSMEGRVPPLVSGRDALPSLELIDECYRTAIRFDMPWYDVLKAPTAAIPSLEVSDVL